VGRITKYANNKTCCVNFLNEECMKLQGHCCYCSTNDKAWDKLRHYEELEEQTNKESEAIHGTNTD
jgi:hypothetical protein